MTDEELKERAIEYANTNKHTLAKQLASERLFAPEKRPVSMFMAGSPGAGKTEYSKALIKIFDGRRPVRIDPDDYRTMLPGYNGTNSSIFQAAASIIVDRVHDLTLDNKQSFILDGTFSKIGKASQNIRRSLKRGRPVSIFYVYEEPVAAWQFTKAREQRDGRRIPKDQFIEEFIGARETVAKVKRDYPEVMLYLVRKDLATDSGFVVEVADSATTIDTYVKRRYTREQLTQLL